MTTDNQGVVYIVDDEPAIRQAVALYVSNFGLRTECFANPDEFLKLDLPALPGVLLLDARMPGMTGIELLDRLNDENRQIPAIMMTGHGDAEMLDAARQRGVVDFFCKPFSCKELVSSIQQILTAQQDDVTNTDVDQVA